MEASSAESELNKSHGHLNIFETFSTGRLMLRFAVPCVISMLVNSIYNIVDQLFIGRIPEVGYLCNGATSVVFPMVVIATGISLLIGDRAASYLSIHLGKKERDEAGRGVGSALTCLICCSIVLTAIFIIFLTQLLNMFGMTPENSRYAIDYGGIIAIGIPFMMFYTALNAIIRADGAPKYAMASMLTGAVFNIIADPLLIFVFNMGIKGAAIATITGQIISFVISLFYLRSFKSIKLKKEFFKPGKRLVKVLGYGVSSFITQLTVVIVVVLNNNLLRKYGSLSRFGANIPLAVFGIVMKLNQIFVSIIVGIAVGAQPIIGYNFGARRYGRVTDVFKRTALINLCIGAVASICFIFIPDRLTALFGSGDALYNEFAIKCFRTYLILTVINSFQISTGIFFQAIGNPVKASICSVSRQILFLVPSALIFSYIWGIDGMLWSAPAADFLAFVLSASLFAHEYFRLRGKTRELKMEAAA